MTIKGASLLEAIKVPPSPFPGLRPFEFHESHLFFGRDGQVEKLIAKLTDTRFLAVVGTSGSGKSSLVRAGLLPALVGGMMARAGSKWRIAVMRPSNDPIGGLSRALNQPEAFGSDDPENVAIQVAVAEATLRLGSRGLVEAVCQTGMPSDENLLIVVDQFEEIFRFAREASRKSKEENEGYQNDAAAFVKLLLEAHSQREVNIYVVLTMRSDFLGDCAKFWDLPEAINESQYLIPRLTRDQLREVITGPITLGGGEIAPRLVSQLLNDVGDDQDQLPVLQHLLRRVWDECKDRGLDIEVEEEGVVVRKPHEEVHQGEPIDLCCYEATGGMVQALSLHADEAYSELPDDRHRAIAEALFKCLTERGEDDREVRRPVALGEISAVAAATDAQVITVIDTFRRFGRSFLMPHDGVTLTSESLIDISHESLFRGWQLLKNWVKEEAESARMYRRLTDDAAGWKRGEAELWRGLNLQRAVTWREQYQPNDAWASRYDRDGYDADFDRTMSFLDESLAKRDAEALETERQRKRDTQRKLAMIALPILFLFAVGATSLAVYANEQRKDADRQRNEADLQRNEADLQRNEAIFQKNVADEQKEFAEQSKQRAEESRKVAEEQALIAEQQRQRAEEQYQLARLAEEKAVAARLFADQQREIAVRQKEIAEEEGRINHRLLYAADMNLVQREYNDANFSRGQELLDAHLPRADKPDLRGFEWFYFWRLYHSELGVLRGHFSAVSSLAFSPDGATLVTSSGQEPLVFWDVKTQRVLGRLSGKSEVSEGRVLSAAVSPDGRTFVTGADDGSVILWGVGGPREPTLKGHSGSVSSVSFSPDGKLFATGSADSTLKLWDVNTRRELAKLDTSSSVTSSAFSPDGKTLVTGNLDRTAKLWDVSTRRLVASLAGHTGGVSSVAFSPDGRILATGSTDTTVTMWDVSTWQQLATLKGHASVVSSVAFSPDRRTLVTGSTDGTAKLWDVTAHRELGTLTGHTGAVLTVAFARDGKTIATGSADSTVRLWGASARQSLVDFGAKSDVEAVAFSPDGKILATANWNKTVTLWDASTRLEIKTLAGHAGPVLSLAFSPDGRLLATGSDTAVTLWEVNKSQVPTTLDCDKEVSSVAFSPNGKILAVATNESVTLWDVSTHEKLTTLQGNSGSVSTVAFSPDSRMLAFGNLYASVTLWDVNTRKNLATLTGHADSVLSVAFSPDGKMLATGSADWTAKLWNVSTRKEVSTVKGHSYKVTSVAFSLDGKTLATAGSEDKTVKLWSVSTGQELATLRGHQNAINSVAFSPDGKTLATGGNLRSLKLWLAATEAEVASQRNK